MGSCSWKPLKLNTANCAQGRGKMQVSFSHVGTGGARKTPPLSLGTWPTEEEGYDKPGWIVHEWRAKVTQKCRGVAHAAALFTMCCVWFRGSSTPPGPLSVPARYPPSNAC